MDEYKPLDSCGGPSVGIERSLGNGHQHESDERSDDRSWRRGGGLRRCHHGWGRRTALVLVRGGTCAGCVKASEGGVQPSSQAM